MSHDWAMAMYLIFVKGHIGHQRCDIREFLYIFGIFKIMFKNKSTLTCNLHITSKEVAPKNVLQLKLSPIHAMRTFNTLFPNINFGLFWQFGPCLLKAP
jgi:hypothetical protein